MSILPFVCLFLLLAASLWGMGQLQRLLQIPAYWTHQVRTITLLRLQQSDSILECLTVVTFSSQQAGKGARSRPCAVLYCSSSRAWTWPRRMIGIFWNISDNQQSTSKVALMLFIFIFFMNCINITFENIWLECWQRLIKPACEALNKTYNYDCNYYIFVTLSNKWSRPQEVFRRKGWPIFRLVGGLHTDAYPCIHRWSHCVPLWLRHCWW